MPLMTFSAKPKAKELKPIVEAGDKVIVIRHGKSLTCRVIGYRRSDDKSKFLYEIAVPGPKGVMLESLADTKFQLRGKKEVDSEIDNEAAGAGKTSLDTNIEEESSPATERGN